MNIRTLLLLTITFLVSINVHLVDAFFKERDKVLYKDLGSLHFYPGEMTRARRTRPVPQLICLKGCQYPQPKSVLCTNAGWDGTSNMWKCKAQLESPYALDKVEIVCEGYNSPDDPFVTVGSCSLEYSVKKVRSKTGLDEVDPPVKAIPFVLCVAVLIFLLYKICLKTDDEPESRSQQTNFNDGNGPDDGHGPQMGWNIPGMNRRGYPPSAPRHPGPGPGSCNNPGQEDGNNSGGPGFCTGLGAGGILGYLLGSGGSNRDRNTAQSSSFFGGSSSGGMFSTGESDSSYFGQGSGASSGLFGSGDDESTTTSESVSTARYRQR